MINLQFFSDGYFPEWAEMQVDGFTHHKYRCRINPSHYYLLYVSDSGTKSPSGNTHKKNAFFAIKEHVNPFAAGDGVAAKSDDRVRTPRSRAGSLWPIKLSDMKPRVHFVPWVDSEVPVCVNKVLSMTEIDKSSERSRADGKTEASSSSFSSSLGFGTFTGQDWWSRIKEETRADGSEDGG